jgi:carbonic anhydrase
MTSAEFNGGQMERLIKGHKHFLAEVFPGRKSEFQLLAQRQAPQWLFITCSDSRVVPDLILGTGPGDLFITRNAGNVAVEVLHVKEAILCGHSDCGAITAALKGQDLENLPKARLWLSHVQAAFHHRQPLNPADGTSAELASLIRGNVVAQLANLRAQPSVSRAVEEGRLTVHGWYSDILTGSIEQYDEETGQFLPLLK